jgi:hypothetical protein
MNFPGVSGRTKEHKDISSKTGSDSSSPPADRTDKTAKAQKSVSQNPNLPLLTERYKLAISERQSWRTMMHNSANLTLVLIGALVVVATKNDPPSTYHLPLLLSAPILFLVLHWGHILDAFHDLSNSRLLDSLNDTFSQIVTPSLWCAEKESNSFLLRQMRGCYRHLLHLCPAVGAIIWWTIERSAIHSRLQPWEWSMLGLDATLFICSLGGWWILAHRFKQGM